MKYRLGFAALICISISACIQLDPVASEGLAMGAASSSTVTGADSIRPPSTDVAERGIDKSRRRPADRERDSGRKGERVLVYFGVQAGMTVLDLYSGGGYYTELLSHLVGKNGRVVAHNNTPYKNFSREEIETRYANGRLPNVERITAENNQLKLPGNTFDAVIMTLAYHDVYFVNEKIGWTEIDGPALLAEIFQSMRPGAVLGIVDHVAEPGSPARTGGTLHRLDPELIKRDVVAAGFLFDGESDLLRNFTDDHRQSVFDDAIRGRTDRAVLRFRKPVER